MELILKIARFVEQMANALPRLMAAVERATARLAESIAALERALQAQIKAAAGLARQWAGALKTQLSVGVLAQLSPGSSAMFWVIGRNLGWGLRDIARKLRPLARIQAMFSQLLILVALILRWLRLLHAAIRAMHRDLKRALDRIADILIEGFRSLRLMLYLGFLHTLTWLRRLSYQAHASLVAMRSGLDRLDQHVVMGLWFVISWLEYLARSIPTWGLEALNYMLALTNGVIAAINAVGDKICGCQPKCGGGGGEEDDPGGGGGWWDTIKGWGSDLWEYGKEKATEFFKDGLWKGAGWLLKKFTPWGRAIDIGMTILDKIGVKDWLWDRGVESVNAIQDYFSGGSDPGGGTGIFDGIKDMPEIDGPGGIQQPLDGPKTYPKLGPIILQSNLQAGYPGIINWTDFGKGSEVPAKPDEPKGAGPFLPAARAPNWAALNRPTPGGADAWLTEANRINRLTATPESFGSRAPWLNQQNSYNAHVTVHVPPGTPEQQAESIGATARRVFREEFQRQMEMAGDQFIDATSPFLEHTHKIAE